MDQKDVEMEDAGKLLEDGVVGDQEYAEKDQPDVTQVGDKQEDSFGVVNADISVQSPNVEQEQEEQQEELSKEDAEEMNPNISEPADMTQDGKKDATEMGDNNIHDSNKGDKIDDSKQDATEMGDDDKIDDSKQDATEMGDDKSDDSKQDATETGDYHKIDDSKQDATEIGDDDKIDDSIHDATEMGYDDKIDDSKNVATEMGDDDKIDDSKTDATLMPNDDQVDDKKNDATDMDDDRGAIDKTDDDGSVKIPENNDERDNTGYEKHQELATPHTLVRYSPSKAEDHIAETPKNEQDDALMDEGYESGTADDQDRFMKEVDTFYKEKGLEFKPPKFYGQMLNCLKLWRSVIKLGGYDRVTVNKWWRQVGEAFHPPKTCTTVSWTFRQFYEKALLEYERHKVQTGDVELPLATVLPEAPTVEHEANGHQLPGSGSGRARRDAAARAMQGWHTQRLLNHGGEEKNSNNSLKREKKSQKHWVV